VARFYSRTDFIKLPTQETGCDSNVRLVIAYFEKSTAKNCTLQDYVFTVAVAKEHTVILPVKLAENVGTKLTKPTTKSVKMMYIPITVVTSVPFVERKTLLF